MQEQGVKARDILRALAARHEADFFLTECKTGPTQLSNGKPLYRLDGVAIKRSWANPRIIGYEVKVSRSDFLSDSKFFSYLEYCHQLYIVCPKGMIERTELPDSVGLMCYEPGNGRLSIRKNALFREIVMDVDMLWYIIISRLDSDRWPFEGERAGYFRAMVEGREEGRQLGQRVSSRLMAENAGMRAELAKLSAARKVLGELQEVDQVMREYGISVWGGGRAAQLREALSRVVPEEVEAIERYARSILREIDKAKAAAGGEAGGCGDVL